MDPIRAWLYMGTWQKLCFFFLFTVTAMTIVRALRLSWWRWRSRASAGASPELDAATALRAWRRSKFARSTNGLAQAALWFACSGASAGMLGAGSVFANTTRSSLAIVTEQSLYVLEAAGIGFVLCSFLFVVGWVFETSTQDFRRDNRVLWTIDRVRHLLWPIAILLTAATLFELRASVVTGLYPTGERFVGYAIERAFGQLLYRLWVLFAAIGTLTWLGVLIEGAAMRRLRPA